MKILILCPGRIPSTRDDIRCFTDVLNYYLPGSLSKVADADAIAIPIGDGTELQQLFSTIDVSHYDAIVTMGLRFYSKVPVSTTRLLRNRFTGLLCQVHDGTRLDNDPVDVTFTFKDDYGRLDSLNRRRERHTQFNAYMGWAADSDINYPDQDPDVLRILVDHTNYGGNPIDLTRDVLHEIKRLVDSGIWRTQYTDVAVKRFDSGCVVDVDLNDINNISEYDRTSVPFTEISREHRKAHIFMVTHPESVGLVVLETAMAGALTVAPKNFIPNDRLATVRHVEWENSVDWPTVLSMINPGSSRETALLNSWDAMANNVVNELHRRLSQ